MDAAAARSIIERLTRKLGAGSLAVESFQAELGLGRSPYPYAARNCELRAYPHPGVAGLWQVDAGVEQPGGGSPTHVALAAVPFPALVETLNAESFARTLGERLDALAEGQAYAELQLPGGDRLPGAPCQARFEAAQAQVTQLLERLAVPSGWQTRTSLAVPLDWPPQPGPRIATYVAAIRFSAPTLFEYSAPFARVLHDATLQASPALEMLTESCEARGTAAVQPLTAQSLGQVRDLPSVVQAYAAILRGHCNAHWESAVRARWAFFRRNQSWLLDSLAAEPRFLEWLGD